MIRELTKNCQELGDFIAISSSVPIVLIDEHHLIRDCNHGFLKLFSLAEKPVGAVLGDYLTAIVKGGLLVAGTQQYVCNPKTGVHGVLVAHRLQIENGLLLWCERPLHTNNDVIERMGVLNNDLIAMQRELDKKNFHLKRVQHELAEKVVQLEAALAAIKKLEGIIPICMYCKKIRDEEESWHKLEKYIMEHSDAEFSHGICPECMSIKYGEPDGMENSQKKKK
ncbi:MAG TPA: hypothetical protein HPP94_00915 [Desulfuromonadales bacterium]|nr:hypothetical protein [Desulfuromonadales bacterium]